MNQFVRLLRYLRPYMFRFWVAILCSALVAGLTAAYAWLAEPAVDRVLISKNETWLNLLPLLIIVVTVLKGIANYAQSYLMTYVGARVVTDIRMVLFDHLMHLPVDFHLKNPSSHMLSRVVHDVNWIQNSIAGVLKDLFQHGLTFLFLLGYAVYLNWRLTLISLIVLPLTVYPILMFGRRMRRFATKGQERAADMTSALQESLVGIRIVKGFTQEGKEGQRFQGVNQGYFRAWMKSAQVSSLTGPVMEAFGILGVSCVVWFAGREVIYGNMTPGAFFSFLTAILLMYNPVKRVAGANNTIQQALAAAQRVFDVLDQPTEQARDKGTKDLAEVGDSIRFEDLSFQYEGIQTPALRNVTLTVRAGEVLALVGSSGAGKTTLVNLIPRFFDPTSGRILIDGVDSREIRISALRRNIGIVSQETLLFDASVGENIGYGSEGCSEEAIINAAKAAYAHEFIMKLPKGYHTMIGENGVKLSGGERQRIAIARAILRDAPILVLDEATSSLDSESERIVQLALANLMKHRTTFVIAHRLSTIQNADRIAVLERGRIVESGSHNDLLGQNGPYKRLHAAQFQTGEFVN